MRTSGPRPQRRLPGRQPKRNKKQLQLERLEDRTLLTATPVGTLSTDPPLIGPVHSPISGPVAGSPLSSLPQLHSNPSATVKLFLDFDGHFESTWGGFTNVSTPVFDLDGDSTSFGSGELAAIQEIWARVSEDYSPFNVDVTTVDPG